MQHQPLARGEADAETPVLPAHFLAIHGEAGPLGLSHLQRLDPGAELADIFPAPVASLRRQRHDAIILDADYLHLVEINHGHDPIERPGIAVVLRLGTDKAEGADQPPAAVLLDLGAVVAGRPRLDHDQADVADAALLQCGLELRRLLHGLLALDELVEHDGWLNPPRQRLEASQRLAGQVNDRLVAGAGGVVQQDQESTARERLARLVFQDGLLGRLVQGAGDNAVPFSQLAGLAQQFDRVGHLHRGQRVEGMPGSDQGFVPLGSRQGHLEQTR